ncbi:MAG: hypothetical protein ACI8PF_000688 [Flavobacteriaceae bacterium]|jgi:hypothetical protein|tara:strand:+ start:391 stop:867 length:477 start_codon:yes stop_codon:yes gene_type:complete
MKYYIASFLILVVFSCDLTINKELSVNQLVSDELETFNWNDVDTYPRFQNCDTIINKELNFQCFVNTLTSKVQTNLSNTGVIVDKSIKDTVMISFRVSDKGKITLDQLFSENEVLNVNLLIDSIFKLSILDLPKLYPAIKRGQPVNTKFKLPILVSTN